MLEKIVDAVRCAGQIVLDAHDIAQATKEKSSAADLVTKYDVAVQEFLKKELLALLPEAGFFGEEGQSGAPQNEWVFVVDPIDGTTNFVRGYHHSAISVALVHNGETECGVIYNPYAQEMFSTQRGCGAFLNGERICVSERDLAHAISQSGSTIYAREWTDYNFAIMRYLYDKGLDYRRLASAALDLCYVACGRAEIFYECRLCPWDFAAGLLLVQEAGGYVTTLQGGKVNVLEHSSVLAVNAQCKDLYKELPKM